MAPITTSSGIACKYVNGPAAFDITIDSETAKTLINALAGASPNGSALGIMAGCLFNGTSTLDFPKPSSLDKGHTGTSQDYSLFSSPAPFTDALNGITGHVGHTGHYVCAGATGDAGHTGHHNLGGPVLSSVDSSPHTGPVGLTGPIGPIGCTGATRPGPRSEVIFPSRSDAPAGWFPAEPNVTSTQNANESAQQILTTMNLLVEQLNRMHRNH